MPLEPAAFVLPCFALARPSSRYRQSKGAGVPCHRLESIPCHAQLCRTVIDMSLCTCGYDDVAQCQDRLDAVLALIPKGVQKTML